MSLAANEVMMLGFVRDTDNDMAIVVTTDATNAEMTAGFLRDPDGRLVVVSV